MSPSEPTRAVTNSHRPLTLLLAAAAAFLLFQIVNTAVAAARGGDRLTGGDALRVHLEVGSRSVRLPAGVRPSGSTPAVATIVDPSARQVVLSNAMDITRAALFVALLWLLRRLAGAMRDGDPFGPESIRRIRSIGFLLVLGGLLVEVVNEMLRVELFDNLPATLLDPSADIGVRGFAVPGGYLLAGLGAFVLAEVFAHGLRLREDVEGTV